MMNLNNTYKVTLNSKKGDLVQYIEADSVDDAIAKAKNTFQYRAETNLNNKTWLGSETQKACRLSTVRESLRFGFQGGWTTIKPSEDDTIYTMLDKALNGYAKGETITEIHNSL